MDLKLLTENYKKFLTETVDKWASRVVDTRGAELNFGLEYSDPNYKETEKKNLEIIYQEWLKDEIEKGVPEKVAKKRWYNMQTPDGDFLESIYNEVADAWRERQHG